MGSEPDESNDATDAQTENPLLELPAEKQQELVDMIEDDGGVSRRSVLGGLAASGLAGALGVGGYQAATQPAQAATNDQVGSSTNLVDVYGAAVQANSVSTDEADVTGETFIKGSRSSTNSGVSSGTWVAVADTEDEDNRNEQDASMNINPDETGWYQVHARARWASATDQDRLDVSVRDVDAGSQLETVRSTVNGNTSVVNASLIVELTSGTNYQIQTRNLDSTADLLSGLLTGYVVKRSVVGV